MLGKGAFGRVNLAMHRLTDKLVAVKSINKQFVTSSKADTGEREKLQQELLILHSTRH
jgi:serine/threonine protein kinase